MGSNHVKKWYKYINPYVDFPSWFLILLWYFTKDGVWQDKLLTR